MILVRLVLISLAIYLVIRSLAGYANDEKTVTRKPEPEKKSKGVSKQIGEYVDYDEINK
jgi:hypothetical protein